MTTPHKYVKPLPIILKGNAAFGERWVQERIMEDPSLLGLGDVFVKDKERTQPKAGRLDLLLQDTDERRRYEVEIQLGATDESHIVRCLEYYDFERRRYQQFDHCAVLIAEDITSRFLNVIGLFNGFIPLIAIQMKAVQVGDSVSLIFTRVVDELNREVVDDEDSAYEAADRAYWEQRSSIEAMSSVDSLVKVVQEFQATAEPNYNKGYIGVRIGGKANNFAVFSPKKTFCRLSFRLPQTPETDHEIDASGLELVSYTSWGAYQVRLGKGDAQKHRVLLAKWLKSSFDYYA